MGQWKIAVLTPEQIKKLKEGGEFEDALYYAFPETFPNQKIELLYGEAGRWKGFRILDSDKVKTEPCSECIRLARKVFRRDQQLLEIKKDLAALKERVLRELACADQEEA